MSSTKCVIILGMHRSGTSMVAGALQRLGIDMGDKLEPARWSNPLGHFEDIEFLNLNTRILEAAGGSWDRPPKREKILDLRTKFSSEIQELVKKKMSEIWGWKDPRTTLTIELYMPYLENPYFIVCYRDGFSIAKSLARRDGLTFGQGKRLIRIYQDEIDHFFEKHGEVDKMELDYGSACSNPKEAISRITEFLGLEASQEDLKSAAEFIRSPDEMRKLSIEAREKELAEQVRELRKQVDKYQEELNRITNLVGWQLLNKFYGIVDKVIPLGTKRRDVLEGFLKKII